MSRAYYLLNVFYSDFFFFEINTRCTCDTGFFALCLSADSERSIFSF